MFSLLGVPLRVAAPQAGRVHRIGVLLPSDATSPNRRAFINGMRQLGYQEARDYVIEARYAEGKLDRLPALAAELVDRKVDVIVLGSIPAALAAQKATRTIPIVVAAAGDFVGNGLVVSLERPGGTSPESMRLLLGFLVSACGC
jgi:putative ABC transport system substrate-binding protein